MSRPKSIANKFSKLKHSQIQEDIRSNGKKLLCVGLITALALSGGQYDGVFQ